MTPLCECHGEPMVRDANGSKPYWRCRVKRRASRRAHHHRRGWYTEYRRNLRKRIKERSG